MVDKLYTMFPEFKEIKYDYKKGRDAYNNLLIDNAIKAANLEEVTDVKFKDWWKENQKDYPLENPYLIKTKYDLNKDPKDNSRYQRNNMLMDIMWGVLTNEDTAPKMLNPGGFDDQKKAARVAIILHSSTKQSLEEELKEIKDPEGNPIKGKNIWEKLQNMSLKQVEKLADKVKVKLDPLSAYTHVVLHQRNVTGGALIGVYANHNASHAIMQLTDLAISKAGSFSFLGRTLTSLHEITTKVGEITQYISKNISGFLAASVDNAKDPVLGGINQNEFTANVSMLLARQGYSTEEIGMLMTQPIILEMTKNYFRDKKEFISKKKSMMETLKLYGGQYTYFEVEHGADQDDVSMSILAENILNPTEEINRLIGNRFIKMMEAGDALAELVGATRCDTQGGAAGPTIADTQNNMFKLENFYQRMIDEKEDFPLVGADVLNPYMRVEDFDNLMGDDDSLRNKLRDSKLPYLQAFYTLGLKATSQMLGSQFPHFQDSFKKVVRYMIQSTKYNKLDVKTINNIYNDLLAYIMSKNEFFSGEEIGGKYITSEQKREDYIMKFPKHFEQVKKNNPDIAEIPFLGEIKYVKPTDDNKNIVGILEFKNVGSLTDQLREGYMRDWTSLLHSKNPEAQRLAFDLFKYCYYRNGFAFGPTTFIHFAPVALREAIPGYLNTLKGLLTTSDDYGHFVNQYIRNHAENRSVIPELKIGTREEIEAFLKDKKGGFEVEIKADNKTFLKDLIKKSKKIYYYKEGEKKYYMENEYISNFHVKLEDGSKVYYHKVNTDKNNVTYVEFLPLNEKFIQYEYGIPANQIKNVVKKQIKIVNQSGESEYQAPDIMNIPDIVIAEQMDMGNSLIDFAYEDVFNEPLGDNNIESSGKPKVSTYIQGENREDANGEEDCFFA